MVLSGCSGGGSTTSRSTLSSGDEPDPGPIDPQFLPTAGTASYTGFISLNLPSTPEPGSQKTAFSGDLDLAVDFGTATGVLRGVADGFRGASGNSVTGRLFIEDGLVERTGSAQTDYNFDAQISGTLDGDGLQSSVLAGRISGDFLGADQDGVSGAVYGDVTTHLGIDVFDGAFAAGKD